MLVSLAKTLSPKSTMRTLPISPSKNQNQYKAKMLQVTKEQVSPKKASNPILVNSRDVQSLNTDLQKIDNKYK